MKIKMENKSNINIYIDSSKKFYFPGDQFLATILLDVLEKTNCNKMLIVAKRKANNKSNTKKDI